MKVRVWLHSEAPEPSRQAISAEITIKDADDVEDAKKRAIAQIDYVPHSTREWIIDRTEILPDDEVTK